MEFSTILTFDEKGFRTTRLSDDTVHRPTKGRIIVLGDSQAMGWGVQDHETFAAVLAQDYGFEVVNLAVSSYGTARELLRLQREFSLQEGDVVVIQYHPNDLGENLAFLKHGGKLPTRSFLISFGESIPLRTMECCG
ncbi:MAG: SGNH/GDSL hydrolase family protein [Nitrospira sp.]